MQAGEYPAYKRYSQVESMASSKAQVVMVVLADLLKNKMFISRKMMLTHSLALSLVILCSAWMRPAESAPLALASARQFLPPIPGYIPVYIRQGDTPLEDINLELAEAFRSYAQKQARLNSLEARSSNLLPSDRDRDRRDGKNSSADDDGDDHNKSNPATRDAKEQEGQIGDRHIQKIKPKDF